MRERRRRIAGDVSDESYEGWRAFCDRMGVTAAALLEMTGHLMRAQVEEGLSFDELPPVTREVIEQARELDAERRRRAGIERRPRW